MNINGTRLSGANWHVVESWQDQGQSSEQEHSAWNQFLFNHCS